MKHTTMKESPFSLVYGAKAIWSIELNIQSTKMLLGKTESSRETNLKILEDHKDQVHYRVHYYQHKVAQTYNKMVRARNF